MSKQSVIRKPTKNAKWITDIFKHNLVSGNFISPADIRQLRDLVRYNSKLTAFTTGEKNRAQNCLTVSNLKLDSIFSDVFGKTSSNIICQIRANPSEQISDVSCFRTKNMKATDVEILATADDQTSSEQAEKMRIIRSHMDRPELRKANLMSLILTTAKNYLDEVNLLATVLGLTAFSAISVICETGVDMSVFPDSKHLCSWAGLAPQNDQSAGKKKTTRISRANA